MNWIGPFLAAALVAAAAPAFAAPDGAKAFAAVVQVCGDTHGDYPAIAVAADANGWKTTQVKADAFPGVTVAESLSRDTSAGGSALTLYAWRGAKGVIQISECKVRIGKGGFADAQAAAQAWVGFAPQDATARKATFLFTDESGARRAVAQADRDAAAAGGGLQMMTVSADPDGAIVSILKIKK
ncbi:MAG: hypothetical protein ACR2F8_05820 [Caulobacteraceae bacterium]